MASYVIGDIQGCYDQLQHLLTAIDFNEKQDQLWLCGDLVARGPKSLETLRFIRALGSAAVTVLGNHDLNLIASAYGYGRIKVSDQLDNLQQAADFDELIHWLTQQPLIHSPDEQHLLVHAGIPPGWDRTLALAQAQRVSEALQQDAKSLTATMYGNEPSSWSASDNQDDQLRFTINALTRMRFCHPDGRLEFKEKGEPDSNSPLKPWFDFWPQQATTTILFGHWAALNGTCLHPKAIALDTGCVWGNLLTAYCIQTKQRYSVNGYQKKTMLID
ncbi:symmetrical bis(5'-nucleosyl)-tetraphosphatase [Alkalimonas amylolytica]|uniref:bis(5'-nucleosyl)-tetraphosphatase (symmetrical) n=1 Tax=Alkalimonas amylolytica TaxID=152573 RepID=A0A1H3XXM5_ALKAM|nr:symmetrical bis(5'-nucleosyl)-tetraphosphatase [Alkalimonas amylolytica]SEA04000.1 Bis(5'nucleosyl)-tetraphosphatase, ApaH [Alkalimonas amylolytica]